MPQKERRLGKVVGSLKSEEPGLKVPISRECEGQESKSDESVVDTRTIAAE